MIAGALFAAGALIVLAAFVDPATPRRLLARARGSGRDATRATMPVLVDAIAAALASGLSLSFAFAEIAPTLPVPFDDAARRVAAGLQLGDRLEDALRSLDRVARPEDIAPFAIVLAAFARTGGRIARSLARVSLLLRGRLELDEERAALTAQGRASAFVLVALPPLGGVFLASAMPDYAGTLLGEGRGMLLVAIALEIAGALWLRRIVRTAVEGDDLPALLDAVIVGLEAGLTFQQALSALVARAPRLSRLPEARRLLADLALGRGTHAAFAAFAAAGAREARIAGLVEAASRLGAPLADLLVTQADALRQSDRRRAQTRARRLPVLMLFPLSFCVLPALLIVFLGPPLLSLMR